MSENPSIRVSIGGAIVGGATFAATLVSGIWFAWIFVVGGLETGITEVKSHLNELRANQTVNARNDHDVETDLRSSIFELVTEIRVGNERLLNLTKAIDDANLELIALNTSLEQSLRRQMEFERWVAVRLGSFESELTPSSWKMEQSEILQNLSTGANPLDEWYNLLPK